MVGLSCTVGHNYSRLFMTRDKIQMLRPNVAAKNEQQAFMGLKYHFLLSLHIPTHSCKLRILRCTLSSESERIKHDPFGSKV